MNPSEYLAYSAKEPMTLLRKKFNEGQSLYKAPPALLTIDEAIEDVLYTQYVLENAYSGYSCYDAALFRAAFDSMQVQLRSLTAISPNEWMDLFADRLAFLSDGHLAFSTQNYGRGFFRKLQTYVSDLIVTETDGQYYTIDTGKQVVLGPSARAFPTIKDGIPYARFVGLRSKQPVTEVTIQMGNKEKIIPVHKIKSQPRGQECLIEECYLSEIAIITCSSFVGDSEQIKNRFYEIGKKCRTYPHVIWNLSNNLGGNSELPKQFLLGLTGGFRDALDFRALNSTLVHAKEYGEIQAIPYHFEPISKTQSEYAGAFGGQLHVIINDLVASSGEVAIAWAASLPRTRFYGCNSLGVGRFGDLCIYYLPNSQITLWCPQKVFDTSIAETEGFEPDYWIDSEDVVAAVRGWISSQIG